MATEFRRMAQRRGSAAAWSANNEVPLAGEIALQTGPGTGEARAKIGDGATPFADLPWVFEVDPVARAATDSLTFQVGSLDTRVDALEAAIGSGGGLDSLIGQVNANTAAIADRQIILPIGTAAGDVLYWDGLGYAATSLAPAAVQGVILFWDAAAGTYRATAGGAVGQALILQPGGVPGWGNPSTITVTLQNGTIPLAGSASVEDAFNAAAPTIGPDEVLSITWEGFAYHYIGAPGVAITTATAADFTLLGITTPGLEDAPIDGFLYGRKDGAWESITGGSVPDAPADGNTYGRRDNAWVILTATHDLHFDFGPGALLANAERALVLARAITIPADLAGARVSLTTGDASAPVLTLYEGAAPRATLTLTATGGTWAAVIPATPINLPAGALVRLTAPGTVPAAFTGLRAAVAATRT